MPSGLWEKADGVSSTLCPCATRAAPVSRHCLAGLMMARNNTHRGLHLALKPQGRDPVSLTGVTFTSWGISHHSYWLSGPLGIFLFLFLFIPIKGIVGFVTIRTRPAGHRMARPNTSYSVTVLDESCCQCSHKSAGGSSSSVRQSNKT